MSALARWFHANDIAVAGYDKTSTVLTKALESEGINVHYDDDKGAIPQQIKSEPKGALIIYTPAIPEDLMEYNFFLDTGYEMYKRSQVLGMLTDAKFTIAVAGTHGKTTTSSMIAHLLRSADVDCSAFVGGIMTNYNSNLLIGKDNDVMVVEADEFDRSFLTLHPDIAIITATDPDHLDIYGTADALKDSFNEFIQNIKPNGILFVEKIVADGLVLNPNGNIVVKTYSLEDGDVYTDNLDIADGVFKFDYKSLERSIENLGLNMPGFHNVLNATVAISSVSNLVPDNQKISEGIASYLGVKRRFEYIIKSEEITFIDDYAHHPEEIMALLMSVRALFPDQKITAIFQPHLYSRTRDFADEFAFSLGLADEVILLDIYPARELPIAGVNSDIIGDKIEDLEVFSLSKEQVLDFVLVNDCEVILTIGAGDIDALVLPIKDELLSK